MSRTWVWVVLPLVLCLMVPPPSSSAEATETPDEPIRVLIVGDSVTQGSSGDWTWRYRLWKHLESSGVAVDFVGPRDDLKGIGTDAEWSQDYLDPNFDRDHAARWGMALALQDVPIEELVRRHQPDIVVEMLGVNDLVWLGVTPESLDAMARRFIADARKADPSVALVMAHIPQTWIPGAWTYNSLLDEAVAELDTDASPLEAARVDRGFDRREDTWDPAHANAAGEFVLASGIQDSLVALGVGAVFPKPFPEVPLGPRRAPSLRGQGGDSEVSLTWSNQEGSTGQIIERRDRTRGTPWRKVAEVSETDAWQAPGTNGHHYEFRLRPVKGYWAAAPDVRSNTVKIVPRPDAPSRVQASGSPFGRSTVHWTSVARAHAYQVRYRRVGTRRWNDLPRQERRDVRVRSLKGRRDYEFQVRSWRDGVPSTRVSTGSVFVPRPRPVHHLRLVSPKRGQVRARARSRAEANRYRFHAVGARSCRVRPQDLDFRKVATTRVPRARLGARSRVLWVSVVGVRHGVASSIRAGSVECVRAR